MPTLTAASVLRQFSTDGVPASGIHDVVKAELIQLFERIEANANGNAVVRDTLSALNQVAPSEETHGGLVLGDPDETKNGYYYRSETAWVWGRGFPDTFATLTLDGPADAQTSVVANGIAPADAVIFFATVVTENTGPMTLSIAGLNGSAALPVKNIYGEDHAAGQWTGHIMLVDKGTHYQVINAPADQAAAAASAQLALQRATAASVSESNAVIAEGVAVGAASSAATSAAAAIVAKIIWKGAWVAGDYNVSDVVQKDGTAYICLVDHTAGVFATDLAASKWDLMVARGLSGSGTGDMLAASNLGDLENIGEAKDNLEIGEIDNTSDEDKPVSTAQAAALATKQPISSLAADLAALISGLSDAGALAGTEQLLLGNGNHTTVQEVADMAPAQSDGGSSANDALVHLKLAELQGTLLGMIDSVADAFSDESGIDAAASVNQDYYSSANLYRPTNSGSTATTADPTGPDSGGGSTFINRSFALTNDSTVSKIGFHSLVAFSGTIKIALKNFAGNYDIVFSQDVAHGGAGWQDFALSSNYAIPASGIYYIAVYSPVSYKQMASSARGVKTGNTTGTSQTFTEDTGYPPAVRVTYLGVFDNMTLVSNPVDAQAEPDTGRLLVQIIEDVSAVENTDFTAEFSRDGGTTWVLAVLELVADTGDYKLFDDVDLDLSVLPGGTSIMCQIATFNNLNIGISATIRQWSD